MRAPTHQLFTSKLSLIRIFTVMALLALIAGCSQTGGEWEKLSYPAARLADVTDEYHGTVVADPYRWLEDPESEETVEFVTAQNELLASFVNTPARATIKERLTQLLDYPRYTLPSKKGDRYYFWKNDGLQDQSVLYMQKSLDGEATVVIDPNKLSEDGTVSISTTSFSKDGSLMAYGISYSGSDWSDVHIRNVDTGEDYDEVLKWCRWANPAWKHDNSGFFYDHYPDTNTTAPDDRAINNKVYWHTLGTSQSDDKLVYERPDDKELGFGTSVTDDSKYFILHVWHGTDRENRIYYRLMHSDGDFVRLLDKADASYRFIDNVGTIFYIKTDLDAPHGRVIAIDIRKPQRKNWRDVVPEQEDVLAKAHMINNQLVLSYMHDAHDVLKLYKFDGSFDREIELPVIGSLAGISGERDDTEMLFGFSSFLYPKTTFRYDFATGKTSLFRESELDFDPSGYESKQVFCTSKDGTQIPLFITHKKGLALDGNNPTILNGYGGFQVNVKPRFSTSNVVWMENGGIYVQAVLRGGNEYGEEWHAAGMLENKQNVFDDFIAAAEWLIENKYTNSSRLAIEGGSNGGLLVAACMIQRPELFGAVLCGVPLTDMLRYHKFTIGRFWTGEYGNAEIDSEHFKFIYAYSPLHNIIPGVTHPPILITTADTDDRVVPAHGKKFAAALQAADAGENPILLRVETKAGHGGGKPIYKWIDERSDEYAFLFKVFGI